MKLRVSNFTRIKQAEIEIDGITVIAGENNTGKSTIGKILFSLFNSMNNIDEKIDRERKKQIRNYNFGILRNYSIHENIFDTINPLSNKMITFNRMANNLAKKLLQQSDFSYEVINSMVCDFLRKNYIGDEDGQIEELANNISKHAISRIKLPNSVLAQEIISRFFVNIFNNQINCKCMQNKDSDALLELAIKNKVNTVSFNNNICNNYEAQYSVLHEAFYIDNPFIIDEITENADFDENTIKEHILSKLSSNDGIMDGIFDAVNAKEKLVDIYAILNKVVKGTIISNNDGFGLKIGNLSDPIKLSNLSTGLKSFVIIKMLLEKGILKEKDVLILDEPEIHLHPEWQIIYAEIIVLLQKLFDLSIVVTTHSLNFLEAIEFFSEKHSINQKSRYYLAKSDGEMSIFEDVTNDTSKIYSQMIQASILLDNLKYEMGNNDNE